MKGRFGSIGILINLRDRHVLLKRFVKNDEVELVVDTPNYKCGVKYPVVAVSEVNMDEVDNWEVHVLAKDLIAQGETPCSRDSRPGL